MLHNNFTTEGGGGQPEDLSFLSNELRAFSSLLISVLVHKHLDNVVGVSQFSESILTSEKIYL